MTTPRIEDLQKEIVNWMNKGIPDGKTVPMFEEMVAELKDAAHQAGVDDGKFQERVKWQTYQDQVESIFAWLQGENGDFPDLSQKPHYSFRSQLRTMRETLDDTIKALQDKK